MNFYRLWHDALGSAGGLRISPKLWAEVISKPIHRLFPFLYTQIIRGRIVNALSRQIRGKRMFVPKQIIIEPTYECNLHCPMCYIENKPEVMSPVLFEKIVREGRSTGINRYVLMGGEPTDKAALNMMSPIIKHYKNCFFTFCTNGTLIDDRLIEIFKEQRHVSFIFSIDGPQKITDQLRGKGTFHKALQNLDTLIENGIAVAVSITTVPEKWQEQISINFIKSFYKRGIFVFYTHFIVNDKNSGLPRIDVVKFLLHLKFLVTQFPIFLNEGYYGKLTPKGIVPRENHQIVISPSGDVRTDRFYFNKTYGNLMKSSLRTILANQDLIDYKRENRKEANDYLENVKDELKKSEFQVFQPRVLY